MKHNLVLLHGKAGCGKTTLAAEGIKALSVRDDIQIDHLSIGNHLRAVAQGKVPSQFSQVIQASAASLREAQPLDHTLVSDVVQEYVEGSAGNTFILIDGFPRFKPQLQPFRERCLQGNSRILGLIGVHVDDDVATNRLLERGSRPGETETPAAIVAARLAEYRNETYPAISVLGNTYPHYKIDNNSQLAEGVAAMTEALCALTQLTKD